MPPPRRASLSLALGLLLWASPPSAAPAAEDFQRYVNAALTLYEDFKYESALAQLERARSVAHGVEQDVLVDLYEGIIQEQNGQRDQALNSFETALLLDPTAKLPLEDLSPKVEKDFETVRKSVRARLARREAPVPPPTPGRPEPAPRTDRPEQSPPRALTPVLAPSVSGLAEHESPHGIPRVVPATLLGASVVAAGVGAFFGVRANQQLREAQVTPYEEDALVKFNMAHGSARTANVSFGVAGLALAGAVVTWFLGPAGAEPTPSAGGMNP